MQFHAPLIPGTLVQRYKRFLADVKLDDGTLISGYLPPDQLKARLDVLAAQPQ